MHGCLWKEGRGGLLKSSTLGKEEGRGWVDGARFPRGDAATHCSKRCQTLGSSLALPSWFARFNLSAPPPATTWPIQRKKGRKKKEVCVACVMVFATCCRTLPWELYAKRAGSWGTHPVRMLHYYLSSRGYESQGMVSGKSVSYRRGKMDAWRGRLDGV